MTDGLFVGALTIWIMGLRGRMNSSPVLSQARGRLLDVGEPTIRRHVHGARLVRSRHIRHFVPTTGVPAPEEPHETADRRHPVDDHCRPHQYLSQPHPPRNDGDPLRSMPKSNQPVHGFRDAHDRLDENALHDAVSATGSEDLAGFAFSPRGYSLPMNTTSANQCTVGDGAPSIAMDESRVRR